MAVDTIQRAAEEWRKKLRSGVVDYSDPLAGSQERLLARSYVQAWDVLKKKWDALAAQVNSDPTRRTAGALYRMERFKTLMRAVEEQLDALSTEAVAAAQDGGFRSIEAAINQMVREHRPAGYGPTGVDDWDVRGDRVRAEAVTAFNSEFSPLTALFQRYGNEAAEKARSAVVSGVIAGVSTDTIGRQLRTALGTSLWHAQLIARTEAHRAYRESQRIFVEQNNDVFKGYVWRAACDSKTCAICWERHGTFYPVWVDKNGEPHAPPMETHPGCRCALVPRSRSLADIVGDKSIEDVRPKDTGREKFAALPAASQRRVLGPKRFALYQNGTKLSEMIELRPSGRWGRTPRLKPLRDLTAPPKPKPVKVAPKPKSGGPAPFGPEEIRAQRDEFVAKRAVADKLHSEVRTAKNFMDDAFRVLDGLESGRVQEGYSLQVKAPTAKALLGKGPQEHVQAFYKTKPGWASNSPWALELDHVMFKRVAQAEQAYWSDEYYRLVGLSSFADNEVQALKAAYLFLPTRYRLDPLTRSRLSDTRRGGYDDFMAAVLAFEEEILPQYGYTGRSRWGGAYSVQPRLGFAGLFSGGDEGAVTLLSSVFAGRSKASSGYVLSANPYGKARYDRYHRGDYLKVVLHEAGHSMNPIDKYNGVYGWEEGVVEGAAQVFEQDFWRIAGMRGPGFSKKTPPGTGLKSGYRTYHIYTEEWRRVLGLYNQRARTGRTMDEREWFGRLLSMPRGQREGWTRQRLLDAGFDGIEVDEIIEQMNIVFAKKVT